MIKADSISLIPGLVPSAAKEDHEPVMNSVKESLEQFDQILVQTSERAEPPTGPNILLLEGGMESQNTEDPFMRSSFSGEDGFLLQDVEEKEEVEEEGESIVAPMAPGFRDPIRFSSMGTSVSMTSSSKIKGEPFQNPIEMMPEIDSERVPESNPAVLVNLEGEESVPVQGMEASTLPDQIDHKTASSRALTGETAQAVEMKPERLRQVGHDLSLIVDSDGKGDVEIRSISSSGSGGAALDDWSDGQFQGKEGDVIAPVLNGHDPSEAFPPISHVESKSGLNLKAEGQTPVSEIRLPDAFSPDKILLRQVAERIQAWRPHDGDVIRFRLEPETLGMVQVDISIGENGIIADIISEHHFVKTLLEQNQNKLNETLTAQGLRIDRFSVDVGTPDRGDAGRQNNRSTLDLPRSFSEQDGRTSFFEGKKISQMGDHRINLYI